jgi:PIN domain nuclease of toxin-antitoxin system
MTAFLLDTNVLLWLVSTPDKIDIVVRDSLADPTNELIVSAASA